MDERRLAERGEGGVESVRVQVHVGRGDGDAGSAVSVSNADAGKIPSVAG